MATIVCHGLPSTLDSHHVESRIHNLRLTSPKPLTNQPIDLPFKTCFLEANTNFNEDSWSSIQSLSKSNASQGLKESTYVHPNVKLPWQKFSSKSLELCTENLGNETGADILESSIAFFSLTNSPCDKLDTKVQKRNSCKNSGDEKVRTKNFPPPLKSMRGLESLRVKPHREHGRLVMELTKVPSSVSCFQAERSNGRLRLSFWNDADEDDADDEEEENTNEVEECIINNENKVEEFIIDNENLEPKIYEIQTSTHLHQHEEERKTYEVQTPIQIRECEKEGEAYEVQIPTQIHKCEEERKTYEIQTPIQIRECEKENETYEIQTPTQIHKCEEERKTYGIQIPIQIREREEEGEPYEVQTTTQIRETIMEKYERESRRRRCKEIGKHENNEMLVNWGEPLWLALATS